MSDCKAYKEIKYLKCKINSLLRGLECLESELEDVKCFASDPTILSFKIDYKKSIEDDMKIDFLSSNWESISLDDLKKITKNI